MKFVRSLIASSEAQLKNPVEFMLRARPRDSVLKVERLRDSGLTLEIKTLAEWFGTELNQIVVMNV